LNETFEIKKITEHKWNEDSFPIVSISCIAFNQAKYIQETLDSFLDQETNFLVEILIHDDASTDGTDLIILEYSKKYPNIFKPTLQKENQYSKKGFTFAFLEFKRARGKYIALCEGDDYWSNKRKLFKQVHLLENDPNSSLCFHTSEYLFNGPVAKYEINKPEFIPNNYKFELKDLIEYDSQLISNCSVMIRTDIIQKAPIWVTHAPIGDLPICLYLSTFGSMAFIDEPMSVYRVNSIGSWSNELSSNRLFRISHLKRLKSMWIEFDKWTNFEYTKSIKSRTIQIKRAIFIAKFSSSKIFRFFLNLYRQILT
jgi:glycosyltransferase involved in cell wall biosynthesis